MANPNNNLPAHVLENIAKLDLNEEELRDLRDVSVAEAFREASRRIQAKADKNREVTNAHFDEQLASLTITTSGSHPTATS